MRNELDWLLVSWGLGTVVLALAALAIAVHQMQVAQIERMAVDEADARTAFWQARYHAAAIANERGATEAAPPMFDAEAVN